MKTVWRRTLRAPAAAVLLTLALLIAACSPGSDVEDPDDVEEPADDAGGDAETEDDDEEGVADGAESLRVTVWTGSDEHHAVLNEIADAFTAQHESVQSVEFDVLPFEQYNQALTVQLAGGTPPDLGWFLERSAPEFIEAGVLTDVGTALREDEDYDFDDIADSTLDLWSEGDQLFAYPFSTSPLAVFYNGDMFEEAGLPTPDELVESGEWTWEAMRDSGAEIADAGIANHGFVLRDFEFQTWELLSEVWGAFGAEPWSEDGTQCGFDSPEMVDAFTFFHDAVFEAGAHPRPGESTADFFAGDAAMTTTQISQAVQLEEDGFSWGIVPLPEGPAGDHQVIGQAALGVFSASENQQAATDFLAFMTNEENTRKLAQFFPPPRESLLTAEVLSQSNPRLSEEQLESVVIESIRTGTTIPSHEHFSQLQDPVRAELDALWAEGADVEGVLSSVCETITPIISE